MPIVSRDYRLAMAQEKASTILSRTDNDDGDALTMAIMTMSPIVRIGKQSSRANITKRLRTFADGQKAAEEGRRLSMKEELRSKAKSF